MTTKENEEIEQSIQAEDSRGRRNDEGGGGAERRTSSPDDGLPASGENAAPPPFSDRFGDTLQGLQAALRRLETARSSLEERLAAEGIARCSG